MCLGSHVYFSQNFRQHIEQNGKLCEFGRTKVDFYFMVVSSIRWPFQWPHRLAGAMTFRPTKFRNSICRTFWKHLLGLYTACFFSRNLGYWNYEGRGQGTKARMSCRLKKVGNRWSMQCRPFLPYRWVNGNEHALTRWLIRGLKRALLSQRG